jgi:uncharacterized protein YkwD
MKRRFTFEKSAQGFEYGDDAFRFRSDPAYSGGRHDDGALTVRLGGRDDDRAGPMSGGWTRAFELDEPMEVTLTFRVKIKQGVDVLETEFADIRVALDGDMIGIGGKPYAFRLYGDGEGGGAKGMGWRTVEVDLGALEAGRHEIALGGYANRKSSKDSFTKITFDDIVLEGEGKPPVKMGAFEREVLRLTNVQREKRGLDAVEADANLMAAAEDWSREMARGDFFRHSEKPKQITDHGYDPDGWGENIAAGYETPAKVVAAWMQSPGHRANILRDDFVHLGIGHVYKSGDGGNAPYGHYWTQIFGVPDDDYLF